MQGRKEFKPRLFYTLSLERLVPKDHELRRFAEVLELEWVRAETAELYSHTGQPSVDPVVLVKMMLFGVLYNVRSERQLAKDLAVNLAWRWFLGYDLDEATPNHSVLSKARRRFGEALFVKLFGRVLDECRRAGLVDGEGLFLDSTLVQANASRRSSVPVEALAAEQWRRLEEAASSAEEDRPKSSRGRPPKGPDGPLQVGRAFSGEVEPAAMGRRRRVRRQVNTERRSTTDPDATFHSRPGGGRGLTYKVHQAVAESGVVTALSVTDSATHDATQVPKLLARHEERLGTPKRIAADSHYGSIDVLAYLQGRGIQTVIPPFRVKNRPSFFSAEEFHYDAEADRYVCPAGKALRRTRHRTPRARIAYRASIEDCRPCPLRARCIDSPNPDVARYLSFYAGGYVERARTACESAEGRALARRRQTVVEGVFGVAKAHHGLGRARWRRRWRVSIQAHLTATVINLKKLAQARGPALPPDSFGPGPLWALRHLFHRTLAKLGRKLRLLLMGPTPRPVLVGN